MKQYIFKEQESLWGEKECIGFGSMDFYIKEIPKEISKKIIIENHYSKKVCNDATTHIHLGVFYNGNLCGALQLGYAMNPKSHESIVQDSKIDEYKELNRMWIDDNCIEYAESRAISYCVKYLRKKHPRVKWHRMLNKCSLFFFALRAFNPFNVSFFIILYHIFI